MVPLLLMLRKPVHKFEKVGFAAVLLGCAMMLFDSESLRADQLIHLPGKKHPRHKSSLAAELMMLGSNIPAAIYFAINRTIMLERSAHHVVALNLLTTVIFTTMAILVEDATLDINPKTGVFGWINSNECFVAIFFYAFFATFFGSIGYIISM